MQFKISRLDNEDNTFISPSWEDLNTLSYEVATQILEEGTKFDRIVTLAKGGWPMTRSLVDYLGINSVASIGIKFYSGVNKRMKMPKIYQELPVEVVGERILLFDDVADSGESLEFTRSYLLEKGVGLVKCATLFYKPFSILKPEYFASETSSWIIFPYEVLESMRFLEGVWSQKGFSHDEIFDRFAKIGIGEKYLNHYHMLYKDSV